MARATDPQDRRRIRLALTNAGNRLSTIREADKVVVIRDGQIVEQGTYQQLLDLRGFYHHLYLSQFKGEAI